MLEKLRPKTEKKTTRLRKPISAGERLAITLRFLATGETYRSIQYHYRLSPSSIPGIVPEVWDAIIEALAGEYMGFPSNEEDWRKIAKEHEEMWQFPHCIGPIDGKHIALFNPVNSGSTYFNYKGFFSIVLLALVDAYHKFPYVVIGCQGRISDGGVFKNCELYKLFASNQTNIPPHSPINNLSDLNNSFLLESNREATSHMLSLPMMHFLSPLIQ